MSAKFNKKAKYTCRLKEAFSKKEAEEICQLRNLTRHRAGSIYLCDECGWWHLTRGK